MQIRHVVSCFLLNPADGTVLLGRRSDRVGTYPGYWAAISGSVQADGPQEQAHREIHEETGLERSQVQLLAEGRPVRFADWQLGVFWVVHPFLFRCNAPERVRPDWEHVRFRWTAPVCIRSLRAVPKLAEAYESARQAGEDADSRTVFREVRGDREHGAEELGLWALQGLQSAVREAAARAGDVELVSQAEWRSRLLSAMRDACRDVLSLRPSVAPVRTAALSVFAICRKHLCADAGPGTARKVADEIADLITTREQDVVAAASVAAGLIPDGARLVTLSYSFTVLAALRDAAGRIVRLVVGESRPGCEGRQTARLAASFGIPTELLTDAAAARATEEADVVLFGADALLEDGSLVNKMGTFALCCAARRFGTDTLAVATESKILPAGCHPAMEEMPTGELGQTIPGVESRNVYFETVPADLVGRVVTGSGVVEPEHLRRTARHLQELQNEL